MDCSRKVINNLYNFIFPDKEVCQELKLYFNLSQNKNYSLDEQIVSLEAGDRVDTLTYFNSFSSAKWSKYTNVSWLGFFLTLNGKGRIELLHLNQNGIETLGEWGFDYSESQKFISPLKAVPDNGYFGIRVCADKPSKMMIGGYYTDKPPLRDVRAALCIGTYKREALVQKTVKRLTESFNRHPHFYCDIVIVDNGASLDPEAVQGAYYITSKNFGGTGAFMRALLHCEEKQVYTHCLFMDDDAVCEVGSIYRAMTFLGYSLDVNQAIAGSMLCNDPPWMLWENGAYFDSGYHALGRDLDLRNADSLFVIDEEVQEKIYGAWWFFIFPLSAVSNYAFPFFIHGDDVDFSYMNNFKITTLNGVCAWHEDFRNRPASHGIYFRVRSSIVYYLDGIGKNKDFDQLRAFLQKIFKNYNDAYFYGSAACVNLAIEHVLSGVDFWDRNLAMEKILPLIAKLGNREILRPVNLEKTPSSALEPCKLGRWGKWLRKLSFNGHLLPSFFLRENDDEYIARSCSPSPMRSFLRDKVYIMDKRGRQLITLRRDVYKYFFNLFQFNVLIVRLEHAWYSLQKEYQEYSSDLRSRQRWKQRFDSYN